VAAFDTQGKLADISEFYRLVASAEKNSEHPLGKAIVESFEERTSLLSSENFQMYPGQGIEAVVVGKKVYAGNLEFIANFTTTNLNILEVKKFQQQGATITYAVVECGPFGFIALEDTLRDNVMNIATELRSADMEPVLLSGDNLESVRFVANKLDIREFKASCKPEDKLSYVCSKTAMIGDGINDAPALKAAFVGIAMGGVGSDIAIEAADITLVHDDIAEIPHLVKLSKKMMQTIKRNIAFSMTLNFVAIALAISGVLNPVVGALVHNAGSLVVIVNSSLLLKWRQKEKK
jgi:P-type E1-E2 ATPase